MILVELDPVQLASVQARLAHIKKGADLALSRALNKTASKGKTAISRTVRSVYNLTAAYLREKLKGPADNFDCKATTTKLIAKISTPKRGLLLREYVTNYAGAKKGRPIAPIKVKVRKDSGASPFKDAFYITTRGSNVLTPAIRNELRAKLGLTSDKPSPSGVTVLHGISISQIVASMQDRLMTDFSPVLAQNLQHEMEWLLQKFPPPGGDGSDGGDEGGP